VANHESLPSTRPGRGGNWVLLTVLILVAAAFLIQEGFFSRHSGIDPDAQPRAVTPRGKLTDFENDNISIYERTAPSLVQVLNLTEQPGNWFGLDSQEIPKGIGSGFVWDLDGHIVTNYHVVRGADTAQVTLSDYSTYPAKQVWAFPDQDIAVLWINAPRAKLHPILVGTSKDLKVGQLTYALGYPFALDKTMTTGIVSALGRTIESVNGKPMKGIIQTNAAINPGNSGGPLLDSGGRLIGMNAAIISPSGTFAGIGFAIPVDEINQVVPQLIKHGKVIRPILGVQAATPEVARQLGVDKGVLVVKVHGPAERAGIQGITRDKAGHVNLGDIIVACDGQPVDSGSDLNAAIEKHQSGDTIMLTIIRDGAQRDVKVTLADS
jgi:S1-C subfamily serine protease